MDAPSKTSRTKAQKLTRAALVYIADIGQLSLSNEDAFKIKEALIEAAKLMEFNVKVSNESIHFSLRGDE